MVCPGGPTFIGCTSLIYLIPNHQNISATKQSSSGGVGSITKEWSHLAPFVVKQITETHCMGLTLVSSKLGQ